MFGLLVTAAVGSFIASLFVRRPPEDDVARRVENEYPNLKKGLLAAVEQRPQTATGRFSFLQESVINNAIAHSHVHTWQDVIPSGRMTSATLLSVLGVAACFGSAVLLMKQELPSPESASALLATSVWRGKG